MITGILKSEPGWEILFRQIGIEWKSISSSDEFDPEELSLIVVNAPPTSLQEKELLNYVENGGAIFAVYGYANRLLSSRFRKRHLTPIPPSSMPRFAQHSILDVYATGFVNYPSSGTKPQLISIHNSGKGILLSFPFDVNALILDHRSRRKNFYFERARMPNEITATVSKGTLRRIITEALQFLHTERGIPFVHKWYFPEDRPTIFTFRVDSDQGSIEEVDELYNLCRDNEIKTMWFVDTKSHERWLSHFKMFKGQEIGIHCYEHLTYSAYESNFQNLTKAASLLNAEGIRPDGAAAPYGTWNTSVALIFESLGMKFSSEFSLDYDDLPFFPYVEGRSSKVIQIPIHPICIGSMRRAGYSTADMIHYFKQFIDLKIEEREPLCLYHHPTHHHNDVIKEVFDYVHSKHIDNLSYSEYAEWWKTRDETSLNFEFTRNSETLSVNSTQAASSVRWRIFLPDGTESISGSRGEVNVRTLPRHFPTPISPAPRDITRSRRFDFRHLILNTLDSWYKRTQ